MSIRINEAYAELAYKQAILKETIVFIQREFLGMDGDPKRHIICEHMPQSDCEVPPGNIEEFLEELMEREAEVRLEMGKFEFVRRSDAKESGRQDRQSSQAGQGRKGKGRGQGGGSQSQ